MTGGRSGDLLRVSKSTISLIGLIEADVENDQEVALNDEDSKAIAELTASLRAVPHATLPSEIQAVLKTSSNRVLNP